MFRRQLGKITQKLYPTGRAFNVKRGSTIARVHKALIVSENQLFEDAASTLDVILPDNDNFTADDATRWEQRLGMITNPSVTLADRKLAIIEKMNHPGTILARQSWDYLQGRLQSAGFNVWVHENIPTQSVQTVLQPFSGIGQLGTGQLGDYQLGDVETAYPGFFTCTQLWFGQLGDFQLGECTYNNKIVNNIDEEKDAPFNVGQNLRSTFFIGGQTLGTFANVDEERKNEFRQLILKSKPVQAVGYLFVNYTY